MTSTISAIGAQTGFAVDDLGLLLADEGYVLVQAKKSLSLSPNPNGELAAAVRQSVEAFREGFTNVDGTQRGIEPGRDSIVIVTDYGTPATVRAGLTGVTQRLAGLPIARPVLLAATNDIERRALNVLLLHVRREWEAIVERPPHAGEERALLRALRVIALGLEDGQPDRASAEALLSSVVKFPSATDAFDQLCILGHRLAEGRLWYPTQRLHSHISLNASSDSEPWISKYMKAVRDSSVGHPYPSLSGHRVPPLLEMYVSQESRQISALDSPTSATLAQESTLFDSSRAITLLYGGPGGGKSTLLRHHLLKSANHWFSDDSLTEESIPVLIQASLLAQARTIPDLLAEAVIQLLGHVLRQSPTEETFAKRPFPGAQWLILVDGLDEVADNQSRASVLDRVKQFAAAHPYDYRFVVATRPLGGRDFDDSSDELPAFTLEPFSEANVHTYAANWFIEEKKRNADQFMALLQSSGLKSLARTPLVAFMLCQLYSANPMRRLPAGRSQIYELFVDLVWESNFHKSVAGSHENAIRALLDPIQLSATRLEVQRAARQAQNHLPQLVGYMALQRLLGDSRPALEIAADHVRAARPNGVKARPWFSFLGDLLRPTGLMIEHGTKGDFEFLHQTLLEYLAARQEPEPAVVAAAQTRARFEPGPPLGDKLSPKQPILLHTSYVGFLIDATPDKLFDELQPIALGSQGLRGWQYIASLTRLGTQISGETVRTCGQSLDRFIRHRPQKPGGLLPAAQALTDLGDVRGRYHLNGFAADKELGLTTRVLSFMAIVRNGDQESLDLLARVANDESDDARMRIQALNVLMSSGDARGLDGLKSLLGSASMSRKNRINLIRILAKDGHLDERPELFYKMITDSALDESTRVFCVLALGRISTSQALDFLDKIVRRPSIPKVIRKRALKSIGLCQHRRASHILRAIAAEKSVPRRDRAHASTLLQQLARAQTTAREGYSEAS